MTTSIPHPSISSVVVRAVLASAERQGVDAGRLTEELGLSDQVLDDPRARIDFATEEALWRALADQLPPHAGLKLGTGLRRGALGTLEYAMRASEDVNHALSTLARRSSFLHATKLIEVERSVDGATLYHVSPHTEDARVTATSSEFTLAAIIGVVRDAMVGNGRVGALRLRDGDADIVQGVLGDAVSRVDVRASGYALVFPASTLDSRMREADPELFRLLDHWLGERCRAIPPIEDVVARVSRVLRQRMGHGGVGLNVVARALGMSTRVLQLRLAERGLSYRELSRHVRAEEAAHLLRDPDRTLPDIAERVGFGDVRSLHRAFKREYGTTPAAYRRRILRPGGDQGPASDGGPRSDSAPVKGRRQQGSATGS